MSQPEPTKTCSFCDKQYDSDEERCPHCGADEGTCEVCEQAFNWDQGGNVCSKCSQIVCEAHTDYKVMREIHEATGQEACDPLCTTCGDQMRALPDAEKLQAFRTAYQE